MATHKHSAGPPPGPSISAFEKLDFDAHKFGHHAHVYMAWSYLLRFDLPTTLGRFSETLKRLTLTLGVPDKYHATVTWFYLITIAERLEEMQEKDWEEFSRKNKDLFERNPSLIQKFYSDEELQSARCRQMFRLPCDAQRLARESRQAGGCHSIPAS